MRPLARFRHVWEVLLIATAASMVVSASGTGHLTTDRALAVLALALGTFKVALIGGEFMELRHAPRVLQGLFGVWLAAVACTVAVLLTG